AMDAEETGIIAGPPRGEGLLAWSLLEGAWLAFIVAVVTFAFLATRQMWILLFGLHGLVGLHVLRADRGRLREWFRPSRHAVLLGIGGGLGLLAFNAAYGSVLEWLGVSAPDVATELKGMLPLPLVYLWAAFLAPVVEELYFRGRLLEAIEGRVGTGIAVAISASLFAAMHVYKEIIPALFVFGLGLWGLKRKTGGLVAPIIAHAINNSVALF
ncbi:MAG TPA: type II CAAX endopeptidase family protein, partial [Candidatus Polarisedimenticolaceae bacterium]|nr:type II CAAX endopeptidase family protein [Candidatus Polarisedimenticolaceae bacterium]